MCVFVKTRQSKHTLPTKQKNLTAMKIVINTHFGGFCLSKHALDRYRQYANDGPCIDERARDRTDPILVRVVEELGSDASGDFSRISVVEVPDDVKWVLQEYDGIEWVAEEHRVWGLNDQSMVRGFSVPEIQSPLLWRAPSMHLQPSCDCLQE